MSRRTPDHEMPDDGLSEFPSEDLLALIRDTVGAFSSNYRLDCSLDDYGDVNTICVVLSPRARILIAEAKDGKIAITLKCILPSLPAQLWQNKNPDINKLIGTMRMRICLQRIGFLPESNDSMCLRPTTYFIRSLADSSDAKYIYTALRSAFLLGVNLTTLLDLVGGEHNITLYSDE